MFDFKVDEIFVQKSRHLNEARSKSQFVRDQFIDDTRYKKIIKSAKLNGLTSFRNKGPVVINFKDSWGLYYGLLCELKNNELKIITVFNSKRIKFWTFFIKVPNRINLWNDFEMICMSKAEFLKKKTDSKMQTIDKECLNEDKIFLKAMK